MRNLSPIHIKALIERGCIAESWDSIFVSEDFDPIQLFGVRMGGTVTIESGAQIANSYVKNYSIGENAVVEDVKRLECRHASAFGNGVEVAAVNENGGRAILIYDQLRAQTAYIWTLYRHRYTMCQRLKTLVQEYADSRRSCVGRVGTNARIVAAGIVRECDIRDGATVEGSSLLECVTVMEGAYVGVDTKVREAIIAEGARVDTGATLERAFVGECAIVASGFSAVDSLIFSSSHLENGEAASIFAGPYTVSHHKSSLLIAGIFSFFNAGSGSNQSNHLFKCGAVHQAVHPRGCKFASGAYIMEPACEGAFTMVKGHHTHHHDTSALPYSYLIDDKEGRSLLMPGANLTSYGTGRDIAKWPQRDRRTIKRDIINYEEYNPYITAAMLRAVNTLHGLQEANAEADEYMWERVVIRKAHVRRGLGFYNKAIAAAIGHMLSSGSLCDFESVEGDWVDVAGAYMPLRLVEQIADRLERGECGSLEVVDELFAGIAERYADYTYTWAYALLTQLLGREITVEDIAQAIESSKRAEAELGNMREGDMRRDTSMQMAVSYGYDYPQDQAVREADYRAVRGLL